MISINQRSKQVKTCQEVLFVSLYHYFIQIKKKKSLILNVIIEKDKELINFLKIVIITHLEQSPV